MQVLSPQQQTYEPRIETTSKPESKSDFLSSVRQKRQTNGGACSGCGLQADARILWRGSACIRWAID
jgi:hypothetical protein